MVGICEAMYVVIDEVLIDIDSIVLSRSGRIYE
jgi:hypothetical protein